MQWCQRLDADYGVDPWIWQSLHGPSFHLSSKLCLCNSFHGCFVPTFKEGHSVHTSVFIFLEFHVFRTLAAYVELFECVCVSTFPLVFTTSSSDTCVCCGILVFCIVIRDWGGDTVPCCCNMNLCLNLYSSKAGFLASQQQKNKKSWYSRVGDF
jgi:hypothetical protein